MPRKRSLLKITKEDDEFECPIFQEDKDDKTKEENDDSSDESVNLTDDETDSESDELDIDSDDDSDKEKNSRSQTLLSTANGDDDDDDDSEDNDDEPEAVSFKSSKHSVLEAFKTVKRQIEDAKQISKNKRRQQDEKYKEQKKRKLDELAKKKLPEDFFDELPDEIIPKKKTHQKSERNKKNEEEVCDDDEEEASLADTEEDFNGNDQDFIPLENNRLSGGIVATTVKQYQTNKCKSSAEKAADFKNRQLYGGRIPRESSKAKLAKMAKKKVFVSR